jgi:excisionase family DNA binding protein
MMTVMELADLNVHKSTIYRMVRSKELPAFKLWRRWRFDPERIERWLAHSGTGANTWSVAVRS